MKLKTMAISAVVALLALTSCSHIPDGNGGSFVVGQSLSDCLTRVDDNTGANSIVFTNLGFGLKYDYTNNVLEMSVTGVALPDGTSNGIAYPTMKFTNLPFKYNAAGWKVVEVENVQPTISGFNTAPMFSSLKFCLHDLTANDNSYDYDVYYEFEIDGRYTLTGLYEKGITKSIAPDGNVFITGSGSLTDRAAYYWVDYDFANKKADFYIYRAQFHSGMPALNLILPDVPFTTESDGSVIRFSAASITPSMQMPGAPATPNPAFPISDFSAEVSSLAGLQIDFKCNFRGDIYTVSATTKEPDEL